MLLVEFSEEAGNILPSESSVAPGANAVGPYQSAVTPSSERIAMDVKKLGYFPNCQHGYHLVINYHIFTTPPLN